MWSQVTPMTIFYESDHWCQGLSVARVTGNNVIRGRNQHDFLMPFERFFIDISLEFYDFTLKWYHWIRLDPNIKNMQYCQL